MPRETWTYEEVFEGLDPAPAFVVELERRGLLRVVARDGKGAPLYGPEAREQLERVMSLVELGYKVEDIAAIAQKVGLPARRRRLLRRAPTFVRVPELARRSGVPVETLARWRELGILEPDLETEGGETLFAVELCPLSIRSLWEEAAEGRWPRSSGHPRGACRPPDGV